MDIKYMEDAEMYTAVYLEFIAEEIVLKIINTCKWVYYEKNGLAQWKRRDMERFHQYTFVWYFESISKVNGFCTKMFSKNDLEH